MGCPHFGHREKGFNKTVVPLPIKTSKNPPKRFIDILQELCASSDGIRMPCFPREELKKLQRQAFCVVFPTLSYAEALVEANVVSLFDRRQNLTSKFFNDIVNDESDKLYDLLPSKNFAKYNLRKEGIFKGFNSTTNRFRNGFIPYNSSMYYG